MKMKVIVIGENAHSGRFQSEINEAIKNFDYSNVEIKYQMAMNENEVLYSALIIIKDER